MTEFITVANRKGGVGKSTVAVMLAHGLAVWGGRRVLVVDLDSQCNTSLILLGGQAWSEAYRNERTVAGYLFHRFDGEPVTAADFVIHNAGDLVGAGNRPVNISIVAGSLSLDNAQGELLLNDSRHDAKRETDPLVIYNRVGAKLARHITMLAEGFDTVILDCAPGQSFVLLAALKVAHRVIVPFRPDYVSRFAVDQIAQLIHETASMSSIRAIPAAQRRYACLANYVHPDGRDDYLIDEIVIDHPLLRTRLPRADSIAAAFDFRYDRCTIEEKYGDAVENVWRLQQEVVTLLNGPGRP